MLTVKQKKGLKKFLKYCPFLTISIAYSVGQGGTDGKKALYHCNYCNKDISGKIRIKCSKCPDFDLCVECFSVGAEVTPHKSNHSYRVMVCSNAQLNVVSVVTKLRFYPKSCDFIPLLL
jgi:Zinc finger, ZZ type